MHTGYFYYTEEIKFGTRQDEGNSQEATETFFDKPKSQAQQRKQLVVKKRAERERERERSRRLLKPTPVLNSVYKYMYVKVSSIAKTINSQGEDFFALIFIYTFNY